MRSEEKYDHWVTLANKLAEKDLPKGDQELLDEIHRVEKCINEVREEMERYFQLAPKVGRYFDLLKSESENLRNPKYDEDAFTGDLALESHLVWLSFDKSEGRVHGDVAKFNYPLSTFESHLKRLQREALERGVSLPEQKATAENSQHSKRPLTKFPSPPDLEWGQVTIAFISDEKIKVRARGQMKDYSFSRIGFKDGRTGKPNVLWLVLRALSMKEGLASWEDLKTQSEDLGDRNKLQSKVSRLRKTLKAFMDMDDDPFKPYKEVKAYETKFKLKNKISDDLYDEGPSDIDEVFSEETNRSH